MTFTYDKEEILNAIDGQKSVIIKTIAPEDSYTYNNDPPVYIYNRVINRQSKAMEIACRILANELLSCPEGRDLTRCIDDSISCKDCWHKWLLERAEEQ